MSDAYQPPAAKGGSGDSQITREQALQKIRIPAIGIMVVAIVDFFLMIGSSILIMLNREQFNNWLLSMVSDEKVRSQMKEQMDNPPALSDAAFDRGDWSRRHYSGCHDLRRDEDEGLKVLLVGDGGRDPCRHPMLRCFYELLPTAAGIRHLGACCDHPGQRPFRLNQRTSFD